MINALMHLNYLAVIVSAIVGFIIGFIWYSKLFGQAWKAEMKLTEEQGKAGGGTLVFSFILTLISTLALAMLLEVRDTHSALRGLLYGLFVGVLFVGVQMRNHALFERKSQRLIMIDVGYQIVTFAVIGIILGAWH